MNLIALLLLLLLAGCGSGSGPSLDQIPEAARPLAQPCLAQDGASREHCIVAALGTVDLSGSDWLSLCDGLRERTAADLCVERAVWAKREPADPRECKRIEQVRTRQSCILGGTNERIEGPLEPLLDICSAAEDLEVECVIHVLAGRRQIFTRKGLGAFQAEVEELLRLRPRLALNMPVSTEVGRIAAPLANAPNAAICSLFEGETQNGCRNAIRR